MTLDECLKALDYELSRDLKDSERIPILQTRLWLTELKMYKTNEFPNTPSLNKMISNLGEAVDEASNQLCKWLKELKNYRVSCR
ncbi:MAG: hypothetical protein ACLRR3_15530 [Eubacterium sp.]